MMIHHPVLLNEAREALQIKPDGVYVDATFGRGGHSREILANLGPEGRLLAIDRDPDAIDAQGAVELCEDKRLHLVHSPFSRIQEVVRDFGVDRIDGVLFDLGVSSPQLDDGARGFSFRHDAPLDMRMDTVSGEPASAWLARACQQEIMEVLRDYGEERFAFQIAKKIVATRSQYPITTTGMLATLVRETVRTREAGQDAATRSFQAIRIHINQELEQLALALPSAVDLLGEQGRLVVIAFHSLEDRIVKRFMRLAARPDESIPKSVPLRAEQLPHAHLKLCGKPVRANEAEVRANPRARSAIMRVAEKLPDTLSLKGLGKNQS